MILDHDANPDAAPLPPAHRDTLDAALDRLENDPALAAALALDEAFAAADLDRLRRALDSLSRETLIALRRDPQAARQVEDARRLTAEMDAIERLLTSDRLAALGLAQAFERRHPRFAAGLGLKERAIAAVEDTAARLIAANRLDEARRLLVDLQTSIGASTPTIDARLAGIQAVVQQREDRNAAIEELELLGRDRPHLALEQLAGTERTPENRRRLAQVESTLRLLLEDMDAGNPEISVTAADGSSIEAMEYGEDENLSLLVRASDDYEVASVRFYWRWFELERQGDLVEVLLWPANDSATPPEVDSGDEGDDDNASLSFEVTLSAEQLGGRQVQFWAEASDRAGRVASSADAPGQAAPEPRRGLLQRLGLRRRQPRRAALR